MKKTLICLLLAAALCVGCTPVKPADPAAPVAPPIPENMTPSENTAPPIPEDANDYILPVLPPMAEQPADAPAPVVPTPAPIAPTEAD